MNEANYNALTFPMWHYQQFINPVPTAQHFAEYCTSEFKTKIHAFTVQRLGNE